MNKTGGYIQLKYLMKQYKASAWFLLVIMAGLSACKSTGDIAPVVGTTDMNVINASVDTLNFYQNGRRLNNLSSLPPGTQSGYFVVTLPIPLAQQVYQFKKAGSSDYLINNYSLNLAKSTYYSLYAAGETVDKLFLISDTGTTVLLPSQAAVRYVNASAATSNLTVSFKDSLTFINKAFKSYTRFTNIGMGTATVKVYQAGAITPLIIQTVTLQPGRLYTLFTKGAPNGTGQNALSAILVTNN